MTGTVGSSSSSNESQRTNGSSGNSQQEALPLPHSYPHTHCHTHLSLQQQQGGLYRAPVTEESGQDLITKMWLALTAEAHSVTRGKGELVRSKVYRSTAGLADLYNNSVTYIFLISIF